MPDRRSALILLALLLSLLGAEPAAANRYPDERPAPEFVQSLARKADAFWKARGVPACASTRSVLTASSLMDADGVLASGRGSLTDCSTWVAADLVADVANPRLFGAAIDLCAVVYHEAGHTGGLGHTDSGLMRGDGLMADPFECKVWARRFEDRKERAIERARAARRRQR